MGWMRPSPCGYIRRCGATISDASTRSAGRTSTKLERGSCSLGRGLQEVKVDQSVENQTRLAMPKTSQYKYLDPVALSRLKNLSLAARLVVEGFYSGMHKSPHKGFSVEFAEHREN